MIYFSRADQAREYRGNCAWLPFVRISQTSARQNGAPSEGGYGQFVAALVASVWYDWRHGTSAFVQHSEEGADGSDQVLPTVEIDPSGRFFEVNRNRAESSEGEYTEVANGVVPALPNIHAISVRGSARLADSGDESQARDKDDGSWLAEFLMVTDADGIDQDRFTFLDLRQQQAEAGRSVKLLKGDEGPNVHAYTLGDGDVVIDDAGGRDCLEFGEGIAANQVSFEFTAAPDGSTSLEITIYNGADASDIAYAVAPVAGKITVRNTFDGDRGIERFQFVDGMEILHAELVGRSLNTDGDSQIKWDATAVHLYGGDGEDRLRTGRFNDVVKGGDGDDLLEAGAGNDLINGGLGDDVFRFVEVSIGRDVIVDLTAGAGSEDVIEFDNGAFSNYADVIAAASEVGGNTVIVLDAENTLKLNGISISQLHEDDFRFI